MRTTLVAEHGVDLVDDDRGDTAQHLTTVDTGQQQVQRLRRGHQDMRRLAQHLLPLSLRRITRAHCDANACRMRPLQKQLILDTGQRHLQIALNIVTERLERGYVKYAGY